MEQQEKQFETVLKKSVAMYSMLTGKAMTEREGRAFIEIFDMTEAYLANGTQNGSATETFDILSSVDIPVLRGRSMEDMVADVINHGTGAIKLTEADISHVPLKDIYTDPASPAGDHTVTVEVATDAHGNKSFSSAQAKRYTPPPITSNTRQHIQGYDWQIAVLARDKNPEDTYVIHYAYMPTQVEFAEHYIKFQRQTHYVHVNEWVNHDWEGITKTYDTSSASRQLPNQIVRTADAPELRGRDVSAPPVTSPWEQEDKAWRIRYYSDATGAVIFTYVDKRPTAAEMAHFHHAKCMAVSQARPKDAA